MKIAARTCFAVVLVAWAAPTTQASRLKDQAVEVGPGITPPKAGGLLVIETPEGVMERDAHSTLTMRILLDKSGWVRSVEALDAPDPRLAGAAVERLKDGNYSPAKRDGKPIVVWFNTRVSFRPRAELEAEIPSADCVPATYDPTHIEELTDDVELPRLLEKAEPVYPADLRQDGIAGQARFACIVDTCGHVRDCRVLNASRGAFARAGMDAVIRRRYAPARRSGKPVAITFTIAVTFNIR